MAEPDEITELLNAWNDGNAEAREKAASWVLKELRSLAESYLRHERPGHTLQATALINEAFIRLLTWNHASWQNRDHFRWTFAKLMRHVLVEYARHRNSDKRQPDFQDDPLATVFFHKQAPDLLGLDEALTGLAKLDPRKSQVVELRFFAGCSIEETAAAMSVSAKTVKRDSKFAQAWLRSELTRGKKSNDEA